MERTKVESSNIVSIGYDADSGSLHVEFTGSGVYLYDGVTQEQYDDLMAAESIGSHFARTIRRDVKGVPLFERDA